MLKAVDPDFCSRFVAAFDGFYREGRKEAVLRLADEVLAPHGGRLFEGFSSGSRRV